MKGWETSSSICAPNNPSKPSKMIYQPCSKCKSLSFHDPSVKHHLSGVEGVVVTSFTLLWVILCIIVVCASAQINDYVSASLRVVLGSTSMLLNFLLFLSSEKYHKIHVNWWSSISGVTLQNIWSIFVKSDYVEKISGFNGIRDSAQTWVADEHSKKHMVHWFLWLSTTSTTFIALNRDVNSSVIYSLHRQTSIGNFKNSPCGRYAFYR